MTACHTLDSGSHCHSPLPRTVGDSVHGRGIHSLNKWIGFLIVPGCKNNNEGKCVQSTVGLCAGPAMLSSAWDWVVRHAISSRDLKVKRSVDAALNTQTDAKGKQCVCRLGGNRGNCKR